MYSVHRFPAAGWLLIAMVVLEMLRWRCPPLLILLVLLLSWIPELYHGFDLDYVEYMAGAAVFHRKCRMAAWHRTVLASFRYGSLRFRDCSLCL
jgi:hypothetical protein